MLEAFFNALSGLKVATRKLETSANNVANIQTPGFKKSRVDVVDLQGRGAQVGNISRLNNQGPILTTGRPIDLAINGGGFFQVGLEGGGTGFTRAGSFKIDQGGRLVTANGEPLVPEITIPGGSTSISIGSGGEVSVLVGGQVVNVGQISLAGFNNPGGLTASGNNLFNQSGASGQPVTGAPGTGGFGELISGGIEISNVDIAEEMVTQLTSKQAFQANINVIRIVDDMTGSLLDITR